MYRKPLIFSMICVAIISVICAYIWMNLPQMEQYPVHWGPDGQADRFGSRREVLITLATFPAMAIFMTGLLWVLPKIEPLQDNLRESAKAYNIVWMLVMAFTVGISALIALSYLTPGGAALAASPRLIVIAMSVLFIGIGNVMGKVRRNFFFGIRTPWTLSSEASWEKTHRLGGMLFVGTGVLSILAALFVANIAMYAFLTLMIVMLGVLLVYSYLVWKADPKKKK